MRRRGFSLIEVAVASAMASVIAIAAIGAFANLNRQLVSVQRESTASDNAKSLIDLLVTQMQAIGGGPIRPWMALWVENGTTARHPTSGARDALFKRPAVSGSDRVTLGTFIEAAPTCRVAGMTNGTLTVAKVGGLCCFESGKNLFSLGGVDGPASEAATVFVINNTHHMQIVLTKPPVGCTATWSPGPLAPVDNAPPSLASFAGATVAAADVRTLYINDLNELREFKQRSQFTSTPTLDATTTSLVSSDVFDLQVQLGYDTQPDGRIADTNSSTDEWLFNDDGDTPVFSSSSLRMVGVGAIVGVRQAEPKASAATVVGGQQLVSSSAFLRGAMGRASLRNLFIFN